MLPASTGFLFGRSSGASPLLLPYADHLEEWHDASRLLTLGADLRLSGTTPPNTMSITAGSRQQSIGLVIKITGAGARGVATYAAYSDGGVTPFQTGLTAASVVMSAIGMTISMPAGTYATDNVYEGVVESWANLTTKTRTLLSPGADSAKPTLIWHAQNNLATVHSSAGSSGYMSDISSDWAAQVASGDDKAFSVFMVCKTDSAAPASILDFISFGNQVDPDPCWLFSIRNGSNLWRTQKLDDGATSSAKEQGAIDTQYHAHGFIQHGTTIDHYVDGALNYSGAAQNVGVTTLDCVALFARLRAGAATNAMAGAIGEVISYNGAHPSPTAVTDYLGIKWNL